MNKFITILLFFVLSISLYAQPVRKSDSLSLIKLKNATDGLNWKVKTNWPMSAKDSPKPITTWFGITTEVIEENGEMIRVVTEINLPNNELGQVSETYLPADMEFPNLVRMDLYYNSLRGQIPNLDLPMLEYLDLSRNNFSGQIPSFDMLPSLVHLNIQQQKGNSKVKGNLPDFSKCPKLSVLRASENDLSGVVPAFNLPKLYEVVLNTNKFIDAKVPLNMDTLKFYEISHNYLTFKEIVPLKRAFDEKSSFFFEYNTMDTIIPLKVHWSPEGFVLNVITEGEDNEYEWEIGIDNYNYDLLDTVTTKTHIIPQGDKNWYRVNIYNSNADELTLFTNEINMATVGVEDNKDYDVNIYPNPANSFVNINLPFEFSNPEVKIFDAQGKLMYDNIENSNMINIDISSFSTGKYFVSIVYKNVFHGNSFVISK